MLSRHFYFVSIINNTAFNIFIQLFVAWYLSVSPRCIAKGLSILLWRLSSKKLESFRVSANNCEHAHSPSLS